MTAGLKWLVICHARHGESGGALPTVASAAWISRAFAVFAGPGQCPGVAVHVICQEVDSVLQLARLVARMLIGAS